MSILTEINSMLVEFTSSKDDVLVLNSSNEKLIKILKLFGFVKDGNNMVITKEVASKSLKESSKLVKLEEKMEEVTITLEEYDGLVKAAEAAKQIDILEQQLETERAKVVELESKVSVDKKEIELPAEVKVMLETQKSEINRLKRNALTNEVDLIIANARSYRDQNGRGHSPVLLETARNAMLGAQVDLNDSQSIKLESSEAADVADYFRKVFMYLLENIPGQVQLESKTKEDNEKSFGNGENYTTDDYKSFWAERL